MLFSSHIELLAGVFGKHPSQGSDYRCVSRCSRTSSNKVSTGISFLSFFVREFAKMNIRWIYNKLDSML